MTTFDVKKLVGWYKFNVHGEHLTNFFRNHLLDGDSEKTLSLLMDAFPEMEEVHAKLILRGEEKFEGTNDFSIVQDNDLNWDFMHSLASVYEKSGYVPGVFNRQELKSWLGKYITFACTTEPSYIKWMHENLIRFLKSQKIPYKIFFHEVRVEKNLDYLNHILLVFGENFSKLGLFYYEFNFS